MIVLKDPNLWTKSFEWWVDHVDPLSLDGVLSSMYGRHLSLAVARDRRPRRVVAPLRATVSNPLRGGKAVPV
eukprot:CAMPEP_0196819130 /NCGR_PEP_ID=MMETSP1362-20130617/69153_1 /TAXON_ID=163516 /ORGANISM="Leptocylindrus danicus, Strain CCMP1856" /LENGTH=71 /DNA_ID=CAMNT_0042197501 /DNA_START=122 /DNA_END=337 /DNA_ORIENTATION=-